MKWVALVLLMLAAPGLAAWLRTNPRLAHYAWSLLGFLPFVLVPWHLLVAPYSTPGWSGYVKGWEVSLLDALAVGIIFGTRGKLPRPMLMIPFLLYLLVVVLALAQAAYFNLALSYPIQLARAFLVLLAVSRVVAMERGERAVLIGLILGLFVQAGYAIVDRAGGALQTGGSLGHQNLLGFAAHMVLLPAFAMLLAGRWPRWALLGVMSGIVAVVLTGSRATIGLSAFGLILTFLVSLAVRYHGRKVAYGVLGTLLLVGAYPLAHASLQSRFDNPTAGFFAEDTERVAFKRAAYAMLADAPMGVGPNHYVYVANVEGYSARAGVAWRSASRSTNVHNSYLLAAVETGYLGMIALLTLVGCAIWSAFSTAIRYRNQPGAEVLVGVGCGFVAMSIHALFEWMFMVNPTQYLFAVALGLISGLQTRFRSSSAERIRSKRPAPQPS